MDKVHATYTVVGEKKQGEPGNREVVLVQDSQLEGKRAAGHIFKGLGVLPIGLTIMCSLQISLTRSSVRSTAFIFIACSQRLVW